MAGRGRPLGRKHDERTRDKIKTSYLINRLHDFVDGKVDLSAAQVKAAETLLKKTLPDLKQTEVEHSGEINGTYSVSDTPKIDEFDRDFAVGSATGATDRPH